MRTIYWFECPTRGVWHPYLPGEVPEPLSPAMLAMGARIVAYVEVPA